MRPVIVEYPCIMELDLVGVEINTQVVYECLLCRTMLLYFDALYFVVCYDFLMITEVVLVHEFLLTLLDCHLVH
jgi:hypothetical protein